MTILLTILVNAVLLAGFFIYINRKIDVKLRPDSILDQIRREINSLVVELNQTTDRNVSLIEERVRSLNALLNQADRRIGVMKREVEQQESAGQTYNDILKKMSARKKKEQEEEQAEPSAPVELPASRREQVLDLHRKGIASNIIAARVGSTVGEVELIISLKDRKA